MLLTDTTSFWEDFNRVNPDTVYLDTETTGLDPHRDKLRTIQLFFGGKAYVYCVEKMDMDEVTEMVQAFAEKQVVAYNASFDFNFIYAATGVWLENVFCLYITERLLTPDKLIPADLESVAMRYLNYPMNKEIREKFLTEPEITEEMVAYAEADVAVLPEVHIHQLRRIRNLKLGYVQNFIEQPCVQYTAMMEYKGSFVDAAQFQKARDYFEITCLERNKKLQDIGIRQYFKNKKLPKRIFFNKQGTWSFNPTSTQQFSAVLSEYGINTKSISKDIISELDRAWKEDNSEEADEAAKNLEGTGIFANPLIDAYYQYRKPTTLLNTFLKKWPTFIHSKTGAIHSRFNQYGTDTGRYSSSKPNRQQAPKLEDLEAINIPAEYGIRSCFISRPGTQLVICVPGDSRVATQRGYIKIKDIQKDDYAYQEDGTLRKIKRLIDQGVKTTSTIRLKNGMEFTSTDSHRLRIVDKDGNYVWKTMSGLSAGDWVAISPHKFAEKEVYLIPSSPSTHHNSLPVYTQEKLSSLLAEWIGYITGDGSVSESGVKWVVNDQDEDVFERINFITEVLFARKLTDNAQQYRGVLEHGLYSKELVKWLQENGVTKQNVIPAIWESPKKVVSAYLRGLFESDGSISSRKKGCAISFASSRKQIVLDVQKLLLAFGIYSYVQRVENSRVMPGKTFVGHVLVLYRESNQKFMQEIGFLSKRKSEKFRDGEQDVDHFRVYPGVLDYSDFSKDGRSLARNMRNIKGRKLTYRVAKNLNLNDLGVLPEAVKYFVCNGQIYSRVVAKECAGDQQVYDITVEGTSSFICDSTINHNCDYSALELAILGILSKDETVIKYLDPELDIHVYVAEKLFNTEIPLELKKKNPYKVYRNVAKTITYSIAYGATGHTVYARNGGILRSIGYTLTLERANEFIDIWKKDSFPKAGLWLTNTAEQVRKTFEARTGAGRIRRWNRNPPPGFIKKTRERFPHMNDEWIFARAKRGWTNTVMREGTNMTIQSSAADLTKMATCIVGNILKTKYNYQDAYIIAQIHDELVVEARNDIADEVLEITKWGMEEAGRIIFPHAPVGAIRASGSLSTVYDK